VRAQHAIGDAGKGITLPEACRAEAYKAVGDDLPTEEDMLKAHPEPASVYMPTTQELDLAVVTMILSPSILCVLAVFDWRRREWTSILLFDLGITSLALPILTTVASTHGYLRYSFDQAFEDFHMSYD
jgi:hypothetical protein